MSDTASFHHWPSGIGCLFPHPAGSLLHSCPCHDACRNSCTSTVYPRASGRGLSHGKKSIFYLRERTYLLSQAPFPGCSACRKACSSAFHTRCRIRSCRNSEPETCAGGLCPPPRRHRMYRRLSWRAYAGSPSSCFLPSHEASRFCDSVLLLPIIP